jgi:hypothetical protein
MVLLEPMTASGLDPDGAPPRPSPPPGGGIPAGLRWCWWGLVGCDAVLVWVWIAAAVLFRRPAIFLSLAGPLFFGAMLLFIGWWHARGPGAALWRAGGDRGERAERGERTIGGRADRGHR